MYNNTIFLLSVYGCWFNCSILTHGYYTVYVYQTSSIMSCKFRIVLAHVYTDTKIFKHIVTFLMVSGLNWNLSTFLLRPQFLGKYQLIMHFPINSGICGTDIENLVCFLFYCFYCRKNVSCFHFL